MSRKKDFNFEEMLGMGTVDSTEQAKRVNTGIQDDGFLVPEHKTLPTEIHLDEGATIRRDLVADLLAAHEGLRTGLAKKATFDFTHEFARALKRWSADVDIPMRDLVVKAVAQMIPLEYIQEYRKPGIQGD